MSWAWLVVIPLGGLLAAAELRSARQLHRPFGLRRLVSDLAGLLVLALLLAPAPAPAPPPQPPLSVALVIDVSPSMAARDERPSRLARARQIIRRWLDQLPESSWALVPFAGEAVLQVPLTQDRAGLRFFVDQLEPGLVTAPGSAPEEAVELAGRALAKAPGQRLILLLSDGERTLPEAAPVTATGIPVLAVPLGSTAGAPVPDRHGDARRDRDGALILTHAEPQRLQQLAAASGGLLLGGDQALAVAPALHRLGLGQPSPPAGAAFGAWLPGLALLLVVLRWVPRLPLRLKPLGGTALLLLLACSPGGTDTPEARLEQAWQAARQGDRSTAASLFAEAAERLPAQQAATARYNAATLELAAGHPLRAVPLLEAALRQRPGDADCVRNLVLALRSRAQALPASAGQASGEPHDGPAGRLNLQQELLRSAALQPAALQPASRPQRERRVERDW